MRKRILRLQNQYKVSQNQLRISSKISLKISTERRWLRMIPSIMNVPRTVLVLLVALTPVRGAAVVEGKVNLAAAPKLPSPPATARYQNKPPIGPPEPRTAIVYLEG